MGKRFYLGLGILVALLALGLFLTGAVNCATGPITVQLEQAAANNDPQPALAAKQQWQKHWVWIAMVADHTPMDEIDSLFAQMQVCEPGDFRGYCARLAELIEAVADDHRLNLWNLL